MLRPVLDSMKLKTVDSRPIEELLMTLPLKAIDIPGAFMAHYKMGYVVYVNIHYPYIL